MKKNLIISGALLSLLFTMNTLVAQNVGEPAPEFSYTDLEGATHKLSDYNGQVVFLFVFGNGCPYCKAIGDEIEAQVNQVYKTKGNFQALGLDTWPNSTVATVGSFKQTTGITFPMLLQAGSFEDLYKTSYDKLMVIDTDGILRHKNPGLDADEDLGNAIAVLENLYMLMDVDDVSGLKVGLDAPYPNPAGDQLTLSFTLAGKERVIMRAYNTLGQEVKRVVDNIYPSGEHKEAISVSDLPSGVYIMRMESGGKTWSQKFQLSR